MSAGATFLKGDFYPRHGSKFRGLASAFCGGSCPTQDFIAESSKIDKSFPLFVQISRKDFLFEQVEAGLIKYDQLGLPLRTFLINEDGHCSFDFEKAIEKIEQQYLKTRFAAPKTSSPKN